jgi:hypothetical protein
MTIVRVLTNDPSCLFILALSTIIASAIVSGRAGMFLEEKLKY